jgi:membrane protease YdiL (CAAX protease family)
LISNRQASFHVEREVRWPMMTIISLPLVTACGGIYLYRLLGNETALLSALLLLVTGLLSSLAVVLFAEQREVALASSSVLLLHAITLVTLMSPGSFGIVMDSALLLGVVGAAAALQYRTVDSPLLRPHGLSFASVAAVLSLPLVFAFLEALFLGFRFWENFQIGRATIMVIPIMALWGYTEEIIFRGIVLRSALPLLGSRYAVLFSATLGTAYMLFWGSLPYAIFVFFLGIMMGILYMRSHSLMFVGTVHALTDTWMVVALMLLGMVG